MCDIPAILSLHGKVSPPEDQKPACQWATQGSLIAAKFLDATDYRSLPFCISGRCGSKESDDFTTLFQDLCAAWQESGALESFGWA
jgi:hypothetical protein